MTPLSSAETCTSVDASSVPVSVMNSVNSRGSTRTVCTLMMRRTGSVPSAFADSDDSCASPPLHAAATATASSAAAPLYRFKALIALVSPAGRWCGPYAGDTRAMSAHSERLVQSRARRQVVVYRLRVVELALPERDLRVRQLERTAHPLAVLHARDLVAALRLLKRQLLRGTTITGLLHLREQRLHFVLHLIAQQALPDSRLLQGRLLLLQPGRPLESAEQRQAHLDA